MPKLDYEDVFKQSSETNTTVYCGNLPNEALTEGECPSRGASGYLGHGKFGTKSHRFFMLGQIGNVIGQC